MTFSGLERLLLPIKRKVFLLIGRAILTAVNNSEKTQKIQVTGLKGENITDIERLQNYGFESYPVVGSSEAAILFINGNRSQGLALVVHDREYRPTDLKSGDVCVYDYRSNSIVFDKNGIKLETFGDPHAGMHLHSDTGEVQLESGGPVPNTLKLKPNGDIELNGDNDSVVSWDDLNTAMQTFVIAINAAFATKLDGGGGSPALTLDLDPAEVKSVKVP